MNKIIISILILLSTFVGYSQSSTPVKDLLFPATGTRKVNKWTNSISTTDSLCLICVPTTNAVYTYLRDSIRRAKIPTITDTNFVVNTGPFIDTLKLKFPASLFLRKTDSIDITKIYANQLLAFDTTHLGGSGTPANPTALVGLSVVNGSNITYMRSDAAPPLSQSIAPTWLALHTFNAGITMGSTGLLPATDYSSSVGDNSHKFNFVYGDNIKANIFTPTGGDLSLGDVSNQIFLSNNSGSTIITVPGVSGTNDGSTVQVKGSFSLAYLATATSITLTSAHSTVAVTATGQTITLPTAVGSTGRYYTVKLKAAGSVTIATTSSQTIDGVTTLVLSVLNDVATVQSDGANWNTIIRQVGGSYMPLAGGIFTAPVTLSAGSTTNQPLKFVSGALLTTAVVGVEEFLTDKRYTTITTGTARKEYALFDAAGTSGRVPYETTNGRFLDNANFLFAITKGGTLSVGTTGTTGNLNVGATATATGNLPLAVFTGGVHTNQTASTELLDINFNLNRTVQFATGALTTQRAVLFQAPTYGFVGASTITKASTVSITGPPVAGTNATITTKWALEVETGNVNIASGTIFTSRLGANGSGPASFVAGTGAGTTPTLTIFGREAAATLSVLTGTSPTASAVIGTFTYNVAFPTGSIVSFCPANAAAAALTGTGQIFMIGTTGAFTLTAGSAALAASTTYLWNVIVVGY